jgi:hypothetical protein
MRRTSSGSDQLLFALKTLALAQIGKRSTCSACQQVVQGVEQGIAACPKDMAVYRLTKFDQFVNALLGRCWGVYTPKFLPKGGFAQGQDRPQFCLNSSLWSLNT